MEGVHSIKFPELLRDKFGRKKYNRENIPCTLEAAETFIRNYCSLMGWSYDKVSKKI
jgi:hypothetical protein